MSEKAGLKVFLIALVFLYLPIMILLPVYLLDLNYFLSVIILFWFPAVLMLIPHTIAIFRKKNIKQNEILSKLLKSPFVQVNVVLGIVSFYFEFCALGLHVWSFSEEKHLLLRTIFFNHFPCTIYGAPIEEFIFYFGATPFCLLLYLTFFRILEIKNKVDVRMESFSAWTMMALPILPVIFWLHQKTKEFKVVSITALTLTTLFFFISMGFIEHHAIVSGHWVYNNLRILPWRPFGVPVDEVIYYLCGPALVVLLYHFLKLQPKIVFNGKHATVNLRNDQKNDRDNDIEKAIASLNR
jgi:hypothetical protein